MCVVGGSLDSLWCQTRPLLCGFLDFRLCGMVFGMNFGLDCVVWVAAAKPHHWPILYGLVGRVGGGGC